MWANEPPNSYLKRQKFNSRCKKRDIKKRREWVPPPPPLVARRLKESTESNKRITGGRLFKHRRPATGNARSPKCVLILRTRRAVLSRTGADTWRRVLG